jgi:phage gp36-like protein
MFLIKKDYFIVIDEEDLDVVTYSTDTGMTPEQIIEETEQNVIQEVSSYLAARYDVSKIFVTTEDHATGNTYVAGEFLHDDTTHKFYTALVDTQAGDSLEDEEKFKEGDIRPALIKRHVINIALYELHSRINPRNIPEFRIQRRDDSIKWLTMVQNPRNNVDADFLPKRDFGEKRGNDISWNSKDKLTHDY